MARRKRLPPSRFDGVPSSWRPRLIRISMAAGAVTFLLAVILLGATAYRTGFAPLSEVLRTGTVTVTSCAKRPGQLLGVHECAATVDRWNADATPGVQLSDSPQVLIISRTVITGTIEVASYQQVLGRATTQDRAENEVIMPRDQRPLADGLKVLLALACLVTPFVGTLLWGRLAWEIALVLSTRRSTG